MKMSLQLHKRVSQAPSLAALPPLASPLPTFFKISFRQPFEVQPHLLQLFHNACPTLNLHEFHFPDASAAILT